MTSRVQVDVGFAAAMVAPPLVRTQVDWSRLASCCAAHLEVSSELDHVHRWFTPWYLDREGRRGRFDAPCAVPVTVGEVAHHPEVLRDRDVERIGALTELFASLRLVELSVVTYDWGGSQRVVLDGNHRLVAALASPTPVRLVCVAFSGPCDPGVVADCTYWATLRDAVRATGGAVAAAAATPAG